MFSFTSFQGIDDLNDSWEIQFSLACEWIQWSGGGVACSARS
jgi:hypothetical protein